RKRDIVLVLIYVNGRNEAGCTQRLVVAKGGERFKGLIEQLIDPLLQCVDLSKRISNSYIRHDLTLLLDRVDELMDSHRRNQREEKEFLLLFVVRRPRSLQTSVPIKMDATSPQKVPVEIVKAMLQCSWRFCVL